jgi:hypothetical protein
MLSENKILEQIRFFEVAYLSCGYPSFPEYCAVLSNDKYYYRHKVSNLFNSEMNCRWLTGHVDSWEIKIKKLGRAIQRKEVVIRELTTLESIIRFDEEELKHLCDKAKKVLNEA